MRLQKPECCAHVMRGPLRLQCVHFHLDMGVHAALCDTFFTLLQ